MNKQKFKKQLTLAQALMLRKQGYIVPNKMIAKSKLNKQITKNKSQIPKNKGAYPSKCIENNNVLFSNLFTVKLKKDIIQSKREREEFYKFIRNTLNQFQPNSIWFEKRINNKLNKVDLLKNNKGGNCFFHREKCIHKAHIISRKYINSHPNDTFLRILNNHPMNFFDLCPTCHTKFDLRQYGASLTKRQFNMLYNKRKREIESYSKKAEQDINFLQKQKDKTEKLIEEHKTKIIDQLMKNTK